MPASPAWFLLRRVTRSAGFVRQDLADAIAGPDSLRAAGASLPYTLTSS
jgi:hypothetical protein